MKPKSAETRNKIKDALLGEKGSNWKNGINKSMGYILVYQPDHPYNRKRYVMAHRLIMEKHLGRYLKPTEIVHHINGIITDNRIKNLKLLKNRAEHIKIHPEVVNSQKRPVAQYTLDNKFLRSFDSLSAAARFIEGRHSLIRAAILHLYESKTAYGYKWKYLPRSH